MTQELDEHGRPEPPLAGSEWETLTGFLDFQRATFAWKSGGLTPDQIAHALPPSTMTVVGMAKHLAYVEDGWFGYRLNAEPRSEPWASVDWAAEPDWEWDSARHDDPDAVLELWRASVDRSRAAAERAFERDGLAGPALRPLPDGERHSLRWILTHMIEEYARHNGHLDLMRESLDGVIGE